MNTTIMAQNRIKIYFQEQDSMASTVIDIIQLLGDEVQDEDAEAEDCQVYKIKAKYEGCLMIDEPHDNAITIEFPTAEQAQAFYTDYRLSENNKGIIEESYEE